MTRLNSARLLRAHDNFVILTHRRPDGDTIGSAGALCLGLRAAGQDGVRPDERAVHATLRYPVSLDGAVSARRCPQARRVISADIASEGLLSVFGCGA